LLSLCRGDNNWQEKLILELDGREEGFVQELLVGRPQSPTLKHVGKGI